MTVALDSPTRLYFRVVDESGKYYPAVEYWAANSDEDQPPFQVVPLSRFLKLLGSNEPLVCLDERKMKGLRSGRIYMRAPLS